MYMRRFAYASTVLKLYLTAGIGLIEIGGHVHILQTDGNFVKD
jgi:hypothetical protein